MAALVGRVEVLEGRVDSLDKFRDGNGTPGAVAKLYNLDKRVDCAEKKIDEVQKWKQEIVQPFITKANVLIALMSILGSAILLSVIGLIWSILTHEITIVR